LAARKKYHRGMGKIVFGVADTEFQAEAIVNELKVADFSDENISALLIDKTSAPHSGTTLPGVGASALGWLPGIKSISIPGAGPFIAAGPALMALSASAVGGSNGAIAEALCGMGLNEVDAIRLEKRARQGAILVAVHADTDAQAEHARAIFEQARASEIVSSVESEATESHLNSDT